MDACLIALHVAAQPIHIGKYLGMEKPSFWSPEKLVEDLRRLVELGVKCVGLLQDPRMARRRYWSELFSLLKKEDIDLERLTMDLFYPAGEEYVREIAGTRKLVTLNISPESGSYEVRRSHGRYYTNDELLKTVDLCHRYHISITVFFMIGLAKESFETIEETWKLWEELSRKDRKALDKGVFKDIEGYVPIAGPIMGHMFLLDPGSLAFDNPGRYGYRVFYNNVEEHVRALAMPSWHLRMNYETELLNRDALIDLIYKSSERAIYLREKYQFLDPYDVFVYRLQLNIDKAVREIVDEIMSL